MVSNCGGLMSAERHIAFLTGTRADFGKIKALILKTHEHKVRVSVIATGMHMQERFGNTVLEISRSIPAEIEIYSFQNQSDGDTMDRVVANTISKVSDFLDSHSVDALVVHGDRPETLAGAISGALRNTPVIHIEGGELSGTIDGVIRHAVTKLSHIHLVSNDEARNRLIQLGEQTKTIHVIGSPDIDVMSSPDLPNIATVRERYNINFHPYSIAIFHPVTTDPEASRKAAKEFVDAIIESGRNFVVIHPNNDTGYEHILEQYLRLRAEPSRFRCFESLRFEYFLTLLKNADVIVGNSSAGIREAPHYGVPAVDVGDRQRGRHDDPGIISVRAKKSAIIDAIRATETMSATPSPQAFGDGKSALRFAELLDSDALFATPTDKVFVDLKEIM